MDRGGKQQGPQQLCPQVPTGPAVLPFPCTWPQLARARAPCPQSQHSAGAGAGGCQPSSQRGPGHCGELAACVSRDDGAKDHASDQKGNPVFEDAERVTKAP